MLTKNEIKDIQSLYQKKQREAQGLFVAEGPKLAGELIGSCYEIEMIYATAKWMQENTAAMPCTEISEAELQRISQLHTPHEVLVVARQQQVTARPVLKGQLTLVLDGLQDPGNMGTIIRTADWFGLRQIICSHDCVDLYNPKVIQATMGSFVRMECWYQDVATLAIDAGLPVYGAMLHGQNIYEVSDVNEGILVIGSEGKGVREPLLSATDNPVTIPKYGGAESLNAAVAAGIILGWMKRKM